MSEFYDIVSILLMILNLLMLLQNDIIIIVKLLKNKVIDLELMIIILRKFGLENYLKNLTYFLVLGLIFPDRKKIAKNICFYLIIN